VVLQRVAQSTDGKLAFVAMLLDTGGTGALVDLI
jgi:hypothetical protein